MQSETVITRQPRVQLVGFYWCRKWTSTCERSWYQNCQVQGHSVMW